MKLKEILKYLEPLELSNFRNIEIIDVVADSREEKINSIFMAVKGFSTDGAIYSDKAIENGCKCIIYESDIENKNDDIVYVKVLDSRKAQSIVSSVVYGNESDSEKLIKIGVTGTNGKTSVSYILRHILNNCNKKCAMLGTTEYDLGNRTITPTHTTPDSVYFNRYLKEMRESKCDYLVMEVSSHALMLNRIDNINFDVSIFTNISQDHFDFHKTMENYKNAKAILFNKLSREDGYSIINIDDEKGDFFVNNCVNNIKTISLGKSASLKVLSYHYDEKGLVIDFIIENDRAFRVKTNLRGDFQVYNVSSAILTALSLNFSTKEIIDSFDKEIIIPGRMESILDSKSNNIVIIDYAHTPDALENIINSLNRSKKEKKLITIFGCGGDRDNDKRASMGKVATEKSEFTIITSDNPRNEEPNKIIEDIVKGIEEKKSNYTVIEDREEAIKKTLENNRDSIILIAGKGHETYQEIKGERYPFSDRDVVGNQLRITN